MQCGVETSGGGVVSGAGDIMLNVQPGADGAPAQTLTTAGYAPGDTDQAQFEADKRAVYKHPLFPLLALLFERCELATQSSDSQSSDAFNLDIQAFVQHQERDRKPFLANEPEIDGLMIKAIQVLRIHLLELEKVQELCKDFCNRYITCLKGKMQSENLLRSDYTQGAGAMSPLENNNNMLSHGNSESGSDSNSPVQYSISPTQQGGVNPPGTGGHCLDQRGGLLADSGATDTSIHSTVSTPAGTGATTTTYHHHQQQQQAPANHQLHATTYTGVVPPSPGQQPQQQQQQTPAVTGAMVPGSGGGGTAYDPHVVHGSTPLGQIGVNVCPAPVDTSVMAAQLSPAPTTPGGSADDCDSDFTGRIGSKKQKRGVLPKHATSVMRSWLFQHLVHPYPTEDEKRHIAAQTNLTLLQVNNWFINARRRILQPMLDAGAPNGDSPAPHGHKPSCGQRKKGHNNSNRRFWPQDIASLQPQLSSGVLSSSDDDCESYSSEGEDGTGSLIIDAGGPACGQQMDGSNGHHTDTPNSYSPDSDQP